MGSLWQDKNVHNFIAHLADEFAELYIVLSLSGVVSHCGAIALVVQVDKTNAMGLTLDEAKTINKSLLSLSNVISALAEFVSS